MSKNTDLGSLVNYIKGQVTGRLNAPAYISATAFTGTIAGYLGFDTSGNILTSAGVGFTGSGTTNYISKFTGSTSLGNSLIFDNGTNVFVNATSGGYNTPRLLINNGSGVSIGLQLISDTDGRLLRFMNSDYNNSNIGTSIRMGFGTGSGNTYCSMQVYTAGETASGNLILQSSYGSVGIGIANPNAILHVYSTINGTEISRFEGSYASSGNVVLARFSRNAGGVSNVIRYSDSTGTIQYGSTTGHSITFISNDTERIRIDESGRFGLGTTSLSGYAMTVTGVDGTNYSPSSLYKITARFVNNTTENRGIGIGYHTSTDINAACIYSLGQGSAAFPQATLAFGVYNRSTSAYTIKFLINQNTVYIGDIPSSDAGRSTGELYRDALGYVKIVY